MKPEEDNEITEEGTANKSQRSWVVIGSLVAAVIVVIAVAAFMASFPKTESVYQPTAEDLEQLQYDAKQQERDQRKVDQLHDQHFVVRDDGTAQAAQLSKGFNIDLDKPQMSEVQVQQEEEAISYILREPARPALPPPAPAPVRQIQNSTPKQRLKRNPLKSPCLMKAENPPRPLKSRI